MRYITAAIAMATGLIVLIGSLYPLDALVQAKTTLTDWAVVISGMAVLVGVLNLVFVQMEKVRTRQKNSLYGAVLVVSLLGTVLIGIFGEFLGIGDTFINLAVDAIIVPVEASLMAILAVTLIYASVRLFRRRTDVMTIIFLLAALAVMVLIMPTPFGPLLGSLSSPMLGFINLLSNSGARGLLIGIALGTLLTGLRVLFGIDRPYGGN